MRPAGRAYLSFSVGCIVSVVALLPHGGCAPLDSPYVWQYEYEAARNRERLDSDVERARALIMDKKYDEAIAILDAVIRDKSAGVDKAYFWRGWAYSDLKRHDEALADMNTYIERYTGDPFGYNVRGNVYKALGRYDEAVKDYSEAIRLRPLAFFYYIRAATYEPQGRLNEYINDLTSVLKSNLTDEMVYHYGRDWRSTVVWQRGEAYVRSGDPAAARADGLAALEDNPQRKLVLNETNILDYFDMDKRRQETDAAMKEAAEAEASGNYLTAFKAYERAYGWSDPSTDAASIVEALQRLYPQIHPKPALPEEIRRFVIQAEAATKDQKYAEATDLYDKALKVCPWWPQAHFNKAVLLAKENKFREAITSMKTYLRLDPSASDARLAQDQIYEWEYKLNSAGNN